MTANQISKLLLRGGTVVPCDKKSVAPIKADILVEDGKISRIGLGIPEDGAVVLDVSGKIVMPGMIDTHRHMTDAIFAGYGADMTLGMYFASVPTHFFEGDYMTRVTRGGAYQALDAGVTTVLDWCLAAHDGDAAEAALEGYEETGIRAIYAYGPGGGVIGDNPDLSKSPLLRDTPRLRQRCAASKNDLLSLWAAGLGPDFTSFEIARDEIQLLRSLGLKGTMHVGGGSFGLSGGTLKCADAGLLGPDLQFAHCNNLSEVELDAMGQTGVTASITPYAEAALGLGPSAFLRLRKAGVLTGIGVDSVAVAGQGLFGEARALITVVRDAYHSPNVQAGKDPSDNQVLTAQEALDAITIDSARSLGIDHLTGSLEVGKYADILVVNTDRMGVAPLDYVGSLVLSGETSAIDAVLVAGRIVKEKGALVDVDYTRVIQDLAQVRSEAPLRHIGISI